MERTLPNLGTPIKLIDGNGWESWGFVAGISEDKGITIHALDIEEWEERGYDWRGHN
jgi:hypothetical protein